MAPRRLPLMLGFKSVPRIALRAENTILVIQDFQRYFADPQSGIGKTLESKGNRREYDEYYDQVGPASSNIGRLLTASSDSGVRAVFTRLACTDLEDVSLFQRSLGVVLSQDHPDASLFLPEDLSQGCKLINKTGLSAFSSLDFEAELNRYRIENVLLAGLITDWGIRATAYSCMDRGYRPLIVADACVGSTRDNHMLATSEMTFGMGKVRSTSEVTNYLSRLSHEEVVLI